MSRNLSEDDIRIIDNRGRYSIRKGVVWGAVGIVLLIVVALGGKISRQARFISELTSGKDVAAQQTVSEKPSGKIRVTEVNGVKVNLTIGPGNLKLLYWSLDLVPDKYTEDAQRDLAKFYRLFKKCIGTRHYASFDWGILHVEVSYKNGKAYRYEFTNSANDYSLTVICPYDDLVKTLDRVVK